MRVRGIGSAPVSFGVYGSTRPDGVPPQALLDAAVAAGYSGLELGPPGFFGPADAVAVAFTERSLTVVGAYVPLHLSAPEPILAADFAAMQVTLTELAVAGSGLAILADEGAPELLRHPARAWDDRRLALDGPGWQRLVRGVEQALEAAASIGVPTSFHPHISTYVESPWEVERLLSATPVRLTVDTGHAWLAGTDPIETLRRFGDRVNHVHLKDVRRSVLDRARAEAREDFDVWWAEVATPLGEGDLDLVSFLTELDRIGYDGWLVVEQDRLPVGAEAMATVTAEQRRNREWLEAALAGLDGHATMSAAVMAHGMDTREGP